MKTSLLAAVLLIVFLKFTFALPVQAGNEAGVRHLPVPEARMFLAQHFASASLTSEKEIAAFLAVNFPSAKYGTFVLANAKESPLGRHLVYRQTVAGYPVYKSELKINISQSGTLLSLVAAVHPIPDRKKIHYPKAATAVADKHLRSNLGTQLPLAEYKTQRELFIKDNVLLAGLVLTFGSRNTSVGSKEILLNTKGEVIDEYNLITNYKQKEHQCAAHPKANPAKPVIAARDTVVSALVYKHIPAPSGTVNYLQQMVREPVAFQEILSAQRQMVDMVVGFRNDTFLLQSPYCIIKEFDPPARQVRFSLSPNLDFRLGDEGFEQINILYHITNWQTYIQQLGLQNLANFQVEVDANGWNGHDQSSYSSFTNTLSFGTGGVKDGQDQQVIIHEYSHVISRQAAQTGAIGQERKALEEANADYFAVSYKKDTDSTDWHKIFTWDGHNEFWSGRLAISDKTYPNDLQGDIYKDAAIWTATLMQIHNKIGRDVTDRLLLHSLYSYSSFTDMPSAGVLLLQADELLYNGKHSATIKKALTDRGLVMSQVQVAAN